MTASVSHHEEAFGLNVLNSVREMQQQGAWCDARITCANGRVLCVHRVLLAAVSPYFREKFAQQYVNINVQFGSDVMIQLVKYCYSGEISIGIKISLDIYLAARKFQLHALYATAERHLLNNLESIVSSGRFRGLDVEAFEQVVEHLPISNARQISMIFRALVSWLEYDHNGRLPWFASMMTRIGEKYGSKGYYNFRILAKDHKEPLQSLQTITCRTKYMLLRDAIYSYEDSVLNEVQWSDLMCERKKPNCALVVPLCLQAGLFLSVHKTNDGRLRLSRHWYGSTIAHGDIKVVTQNQMYVVDCKNAVRILRVDSGQFLMADTSKRVPAALDQIYNISADQYDRLVIYGSRDGQKMLTYDCAGASLTLEEPDRVARALDVVHIPGTQILYQVWSGHLEEIHITKDRCVPRWPKRVIFLPKDTQVRRILHTFCDKQGIVILVQDVWSSRHSVLRYSQNQWEMLLQLDGLELGVF
ncbi:uncharacterized protein LOC111243279 [Varroa destructor]|uniref:BTB domain-containing protein n=1 Tax=Varroa destructor TaxID=109461 RepID=A0A7M7M8R1_VARDE|nr:uncharacterized protein LOC111243279 [Varroa destructor]